MGDDYGYRIPNSGPGWISVIVISVLSSCTVLAAFQWATTHGIIPNSVLAASASAPAAPDASKSDPVKVPGLVGLPLNVAAELLDTRGLRLVVREKHEHAEAPVDSVIAQDPLPDSSLPANSPVSVTLSSGPPREVAIPDMVGQSLEAAKSALEAAGFVVGEVSGPATGERVVASSTPPPGTAAPRGATVSITLEAVGIEVPQLVGLSWSKAKKLLEEKRLGVGKVRERFDEDRAPFVVLQQTPEAGARVPEGSKIDLVRNEE